MFASKSAGQLTESTAEAPAIGTPAGATGTATNAEAGTEAEAVAGLRLDAGADTAIHDMASRRRRRGSSVARSEERGVGIDGRFTVLDKTQILKARRRPP